MTDEELEEIKEAVEESFGRILTIETGLRQKSIQIDKIIVKRKEIK